VTSSIPASDSASNEPAASGGNARVRVEVDHSTCSGTAHCQQSMPNVFVVKNRRSHVRADVDWESVDIDRLNDTVEACPWFAISVTVTNETN
jgi:ferredoxin